MITAQITKSTSSWETYGEKIFSIEQSVFGDKAFNKEMMEADFNDPKTIVAILKDKEELIGFAYAQPEDDKVACVVDIAIVQEFQNKGLVAKLMNCIEEELKISGYEYMTEHAMIDNGYADKIERNYGERIIEKRDFVSEFGNQRYFKIRLLSVD